MGEISVLIILCQHELFDNCSLGMEDANFGRKLGEGFMGCFNIKTKKLKCQVLRCIKPFIKTKQEKKKKNVLDVF